MPGVGKVIAIAFICATNNFTKFETAKALGSYCGVVLFGRESGKYRGKEMVLPIATKTEDTPAFRCKSNNKWKQSIHEILSKKDNG
ncbi:MAG: IS110 family transposase [Saprospiraceae bacterium]|nr:IS110 family transposase [Saprospiraceae bacterium]